MNQKLEVKPAPEAKTLFEYVYPDRGGYTFFSINVWEVILSPFEDSGWQSINILLEARYVIFGQILHHYVRAANMDQGEGYWKQVLHIAEFLKVVWTRRFSEYEDSYKKFWKENPKAHGCMWDDALQCVVESLYGK